MEFLQGFFNQVADFLQQAIGFVLLLLPRSPLQQYFAELGTVEWLGYLNWFIPFGRMAAIGTAWLTAIGVFYAYQIILRWVKAVDA